MLLQQLKLCPINSPPTARVRRADEGSDDDIDDKVDVDDDDALTEAAAGDSIDVDDNDDDDNDDDNDYDNNDDNDNDELEMLVDVKKLNTKMSAADKRALFAKVMSEQHKELDRDVLAGAWAMLKPAFKKKFQKRVWYDAKQRLMLMSKNLFRICFNFSFVGCEGKAWSSVAREQARC